MRWCFCMLLEARCLTIDEVLSKDYQPSATADTALAAQRLDTWKHFAAGGNKDRFLQRLKRDGLSLQNVRERLSGVERCEGIPCPDWFHDAVAVIDQLQDSTYDLIDEKFNDQPFAPLLDPLVRASVQQIEIIPSWNTRLSSDARESAKQQLWQKIVDVLALPLLDALNDWRQNQSTRVKSFAAFCEFMRQSGFNSLFNSKPILARLAGTVCRQWVVGYTRFLKRFESDEEDLRLFFRLSREIMIEELGWGLSDPHFDGETVLRLELSQGPTVFYKPRSFAPDLAVKQFLNAFSAHIHDFDLSIPSFLDRGEYGWAANVPEKPCLDEASVGRYFERAGQWLGVFHLLAASDIHMENIIASGDLPVPVDLETILQAIGTIPNSMPEGAEAVWKASNILERSVLSVGLLPGYVLAEDGASISVGGLEPSVVESKHLFWSDINTYGMSAKLEKVRTVVESNLPVFKGNRVSADEWRNEILHGLKTVLDAADKHRSELGEYLKSIGAKLEVRRVIRPTRFYYLLIRRLLDHRTMGDGVNWSLQTELIARLYDWDEAADQPWKLFREERLALCQMTVPKFTLQASRTVVSHGNREVTNLHATDGLTVATARIGDLSARATANQIQFAKVALGQTQNEAYKQHRTEMDFVKSLVDHLEQSAIQTDHSAAWLGLEYKDHKMMSQVVPIGLDLYNGNTGIALFFAAAGRFCRDDRAKQLAANAIAPLLSAVHSENRDRMIRTMGVGGFLGVGSALYALVVFAELQHDETSLTAACELSSLLNHEVIARDRRFDLVSGSAGAILSLLKLYDVTGRSQFLDQAVMAADQLLTMRDPKSNQWVSASFQNLPITGMSHGTAGFALAYGKLATQTNCSRYHKIAANTMAFEDKYFDQITKNWQDTRPTSMRGGNRNPNQWCYGAIGIAYGRIALAEAGFKFTHEELARVKSVSENVITLHTTSNDTLCCGTAGKIDFLAQAANYWKLQHFQDAAEADLAKVQSRWFMNGDVRWDIGNSDFNLGLMRGVAGIGYAALRVREKKTPPLLVMS